MKELIFTLAIMIALGTAAQENSTTKTQDHPQKATTSHAQAATTGDEVFQANCSRCHTPPMSISPRTTGTIIMHMRTRARLSREDEIKLLRFMAP
jgi:cytochrome c5